MNSVDRESFSQSGTLALLGAGRNNDASHTTNPVKQAEDLQCGIASLVLNLVETVIEILERQAFRKFNAGSLTEQEVERLGIAFAQMRERMAEVASKFDYQPRALEISLKADHNDILGPMALPSDGSAHAVSLVEIVDKLIDKGAVLAGDIRLAVAGVDLVTLNLIASIKSESESSHTSKENNQVGR